MNPLPKQLVLLGPPGSGKGTQAKILAGKLAVPHISTGDIFREQISQGTALGKKAEPLLAEGKLMPDDITNAVIKQRLARSDAAAGFILDGYPRNLTQAEFLFTVVPATVAIAITLSDQEVVARIAGRRLSTTTGAIYHLQYNPPPANLPADDLIQRSDETEAVVRERLKIHHRETKPLLAFYRAQGKLLTVDGSPPIAEVTTAIIKLLSR